MSLKVKFLKWSTGVPVAMLNEKTAEKIGIHALDRISIKTLSSPSREISTITNTIVGVVGENEIAISAELKKILDLKKGQKVDVSFSPNPKSIIPIKKKLDKKRLSQYEINEIVEDIVSNSLSESEIALFVSAMYQNGMTMRETIYLTNAIIKTGNVLRLKTKYSADKHSIGGIPGNRTTPLVVSICAAAGLTVPKTSSRSITSAAGTADVIEAIANVEFSIEDLKEILKKTNACLVWGGTLGIAPADDKIIKIESILKIDPMAQLLASIMSKKLAMGSRNILIDIPYGEGAKVNRIKAIELKKKFEHLGKHFHKNIKCVLTDGTQPIGNGVGPALELIDVIRILKAEGEPKDLERKSLFLSGELLELAGKAKKSCGFEMARQILYSGEAFEKFKEIIKAQGGHPNLLEKLKPAKFKKDIFSDKSGIVSRIQNKEINSLARITGCPIDKASGLYLHFHVGDKIKKGERLLTIYSEAKSRLKEAIVFYTSTKPIRIE